MMPPGRRTAPEVCVNAMGCFTWGLKGRPKVQGHRGAGYTAPPNSMEAMIRATQMGLHSIEFDVWQLKCDTLIVAHGPEFLEPGDIGLRKHTLKELQEDGEEFSFFSEVVKFCVKKDMKMNIDVKGDDAYVVDEILGQLEFLGATHMACVSSFDPKVLERVLQLNGRLKIGVLHDPYAVYSDRPTFIPSKKQPLRKDFASYLVRPGDSINLGAEVVTPEIVAECHKRGVEVMAWFACVPQVEDAEETLTSYERLLRAGVDTICTNHPKRLQEYLDARFLAGYSKSVSPAGSTRANSLSRSPSSVTPESLDTPVKASSATSSTMDICESDCYSY